MFNFFEKSDSQLEKDVVSELQWDARVSSSDVKVTSKNGIITLRGTVPHYYERTTAEEAAQRVAGVRAVADELEVQLVDASAQSDQDIASAALSALAWNYSTPKDVRVTVDNGWVSLNGTAEWDYQRNAAKDSVSQLQGVRGVSNNIELKFKTMADDLETGASIKIGIEEALKRSAESEGQKIKVSVSGSHVTISGKVHSLAEKEDARLAAWNAPGVMMVENNLEVAQN